MTRYTRPVVIAVAALVVMSCDSGSFVDPEGAETIGQPAALQLGGLPDTVTEQDTVTLTATVVDDMGEPIAVDGIEWNSSDAGVASVESIESNRASLTAKKPGTTTIEVTYENLSARADLRVHNRPVDLILESGDNQTGGPGQQLKDPLVVFAVDRRGDPVEGVSVQFSVVKGAGKLSTETSRTDASGLASTKFTLGPDAEAQRVQAFADPNQARVKNMKDSIVEFTASLELDISAVDVTPHNATVEAGDSIQLDVSASTPDGGTINDPGVAWASSDTTVATVNNRGVLKGRKGGSAFAIARMQSTTGTVADSAEVTVTATASAPAPELARVVVSPDAVTLDEGATSQLSATAYDTNDAKMSGVTFDWTSSNGDVAGVDQSGKVTAKAAGAALIIAAAAGIADTASVTVQSVAPAPPPPANSSGIWMSTEEIQALPTSGSAWSNVKSEADRSCGTPDLANQDDDTNVCVMAKALVYARIGGAQYRDGVVSAIRSLVNSGTYSGRALALGRELGAYVIAADLIGLPSVDATLDGQFRSKLRELRTTSTNSGPGSLVECHERRPNNWGNHCGASLTAIAVYLGDDAALDRIATVFRGYLGDRSAYANFSYGSDLSWQADPSRPVGINPKGATKEGHNIDGLQPEEQRRCGSWQWPPCNSGYLWEGLQGSIAMAWMLHRQGYAAFDWNDQALRRAIDYNHRQGWPAESDDTWIPHIVNAIYGTSYPAPTPSRPGKNVGWTDWTHGG